MNVTNHVAKTIEDIFTPFQYKIDPSLVTFAKCIAYQNFGGDDARAVYEIHVENKPRFFAVSTLEYPEEVEAEQGWVSEWTESKDVKSLEKREAEYLDFYLFELTSPFGISFESNLGE